MIKTKKKYTISAKVKEQHKKQSELKHMPPNKIHLNTSGKNIVIFLNKNKTTIIDTEDYNKIKMYTWHIYKGRNTYYAVSNTSRTSGLKRKILQLHRLILDLKPGISTDHINGNGLDNRKVNLRVVTKQQNHFNRVKMKDKKYTSIYKGVCWYDKKWHAQIGVNGKIIHLGSFSKEKEAGLAYDRKAKELFGEYAKLNFPRGCK